MMLTSLKALVLIHCNLLFCVSKNIVSESFTKKRNVLIKYIFITSLKFVIKARKCNDSLTILSA